MSYNSYQKNIEDDIEQFDDDENGFVVPHIKISTQEKNTLRLNIEEYFNVDAKDNKSTIRSLVDNLTWQICKLKIVRHQIDASGMTVNFHQGKQRMLIQNPLIKTYNDLIKNYTVTIKTLRDLTGTATEGTLTAEEKNAMDFMQGKKIKR